jgi:hypothetical protein
MEGFRQGKEMTFEWPLAFLRYEAQTGKEKVPELWLPRTLGFSSCPRDFRNDIVAFDPWKF